MSELPNIIVTLWFLPVLIFIVIPLTMLCCRSLYKLTMSWRDELPQEDQEDQEDQVVIITDTRGIHLN